MPNGIPHPGPAGPALNPPLTGVSGDPNTAGVTGNNLARRGAGVFGTGGGGGVGVFGTCGGGGIGVFGTCGLDGHDGLAGRFKGNVEVLGKLFVNGYDTAIYKAVIGPWRTHGIFTMGLDINVDFNQPPLITSNSVVMASLTELDGNGNPFMGVASMKVYNVVPSRNHVDIRGEIDWDNDLNIRATLLIANPPQI